jgi:dTDP-glucose 4,6-dehydratase
LVRLTYAGNLDNLADIESGRRYRFCRGDICDPADVEAAMAGADAVVNFAAETHVDHLVVVAREQVADEVAADEAGAAGDEDPLRTRTPPWLLLQC